MKQRDELRLGDRVVPRINPDQRSGTITAFINWGLEERDPNDKDCLVHWDEGKRRLERPIELRREDASAS